MTSNPIVRYNPANATLEVEGAVVDAPGTGATYQAAGDEDYEITRTSSRILVELTVALTDSHTFTLPTSPQVGDSVTTLRSQAGAEGATWSRSGGDGSDDLRGIGDHITYHWNGSNWARLIRRREQAPRIDAATYELTLGDDKHDLTFHTTACLVTFPNDLPQGFACRLVQHGSEVVTRTMESGATTSPSSAPTATNGDGSALFVLVVRNADGVSAIYRVIREIPDAGVGGGDTISDGGAFDPAAVLMTSAAAAEYDALTISAAPTFTLSGDIEAGGYASVLVTVTGGPHTITWGAEFRAAVGSLPESIEDGTYLFTFMGHPDMAGAGQDRVKVYIPGITVPAHTHAQSEITSLVSDLAAKAPSSSPTLSNPTFTGTVTVPDNALAIADTSGLQAALDAKLALAGGTVTGAIALGSGGSLGDAGPISASGALTKATHSERAVLTTGNVTIPNAAGDVGMRGMIILGGAHTITFNSTATATLGSGDVFCYYVQSTTVLKRSLIASADQPAMT